MCESPAPFPFDCAGSATDGIWKVDGYALDPDVTHALPEQVRLIVGSLDDAK